MEFTRLASRNHEQVKEYCKLANSAKARSRSGRFILEGLRLCADCADSGFTPETLFLTDEAYAKGGERLNRLLERAGRVYLVEQTVAQKLSDTVSPQGVFCIVQQRSTALSTWRANGKYVLLDNVQNPQNLGAIARTAEALGINALVLYAGCDPYNPKALRASMGSLLRLPVYETEDLIETVTRLGETMLTFATVPDSSAQSITAQDFSHGAAAVIGNEANGVSEGVLAAVQRRVTIPMRGSAESLNAAAAATVTMWEMMK